MSLTKLKADRIFDGRQFLEPDRVLISTSAGRIIDIIPADTAGDEIRSFTGILCPGFINSHCHLELSHLHGQTRRETGLVTFLQEVVGKRSFPPEAILEAMIQADHRMYQSGIEAVGDICNTADSIPVKANSAIRWYNFTEVLSSRDELAELRLNHYTSLRNHFRAALNNLHGTGRTMPASLAPHAPYSVSPESFARINAASAGETISLHSQESMAEDMLYRHGNGPFLDFFKSIGLHESPFPHTRTSSLKAVLTHFTHRQRIILVHNTYATEADLHFADHYAAEKELSVFYCLCPNANLFIEQRLPPIDLLMGAGRKIVLGTDSLASNDQLSIASEIRTIMNAYPSVTLEMGLRWATSGGAMALGFDQELGTFDPGKKPGILLLDESLRIERLY